MVQQILQHCAEVLGTSQVKANQRNIAVKLGNLKVRVQKLREEAEALTPNEWTAVADKVSAQLVLSEELSGKIKTWVHRIYQATCCAESVDPFNEWERKFRFHEESEELRLPENTSAEDKLYQKALKHLINSMYKAGLVAKASTENDAIIFGNLFDGKEISKDLLDHMIKVRALVILRRNADMALAGLTTTHSVLLEEAVLPKEITLPSGKTIWETHKNKNGYTRINYERYKVYPGKEPLPFARKETRHQKTTSLPVNAAELMSIGAYRVNTQCKVGDKTLFEKAAEAEIQQILATISEATKLARDKRAKYLKNVGLEYLLNGRDPEALTVLYDSGYLEAALQSDAEMIAQGLLVFGPTRNDPRGRMIHWQGIMLNPCSSKFMRAVLVMPERVDSSYPWSYVYDRVAGIRKPFKAWNATTWQDFTNWGRVLLKALVNSYTTAEDPSQWLEDNFDWNDPEEVNLVSIVWAKAMVESGKTAYFTAVLEYDQTASWAGLSAAICHNHKAMRQANMFAWNVFDSRFKYDPYYIAVNGRVIPRNLAKALMTPLSYGKRIVTFEDLVEIQGQMLSDGTLLEFLKDGRIYRRFLSKHYSPFGEDVQGLRNNKQYLQDAQAVVEYCLTLPAVKMSRYLQENGYQKPMVDIVYSHKGYHQMAVCTKGIKVEGQPVYFGTGCIGSHLEATPKSVNLVFDQGTCKFNAFPVSIKRMTSYYGTAKLQHEDAVSAHIIVYVLTMLGIPIYMVHDAAFTTPRGCQLVHEIVNMRHWQMYQDAEADWKAFFQSTIPNFSEDDWKKFQQLVDWDDQSVTEEQMMLGHPFK